MKKQPLIQPIKFEEDFILIKNALIDLGKVTNIRLGKCNVLISYIATTRNTWLIDDENYVTYYPSRHPEIPESKEYLEDEAIRREAETSSGGFWPIKLNGKEFQSLLDFLRKRFKPKEITEG